MLPDWLAAIGFLLKHRTEILQGSRVVTFELVQRITASLGLQPYDGNEIAAIQEDAVSVRQATWMRYALGCYLAVLNDGSGKCCAHQTYVQHYGAGGACEKTVGSRKAWAETEVLRMVDVLVAQHMSRWKEYRSHLAAHA
jgi:hypothetical protein